MGGNLNDMRKAGRHFLQIPGPSAVPERILSAISRQTIDHRGPEFAKVGGRALEGMKGIFKTESHVFIYPSSGTGASTGQTSAQVPQSTQASASREALAATRRHSSVNIQVTPGSLNWLAMVG